MRRILHIIDSLGRNGLAKQLQMLARGEPESGFDVHVAALGGRGALATEFSAAGIAVTQLDRRWSRDPVALVRLQRITSRLRPDMVHTWSGDAAWYGRFAVGASGSPRLIVGVHRIDRWKSGWDWRADRWLARRVERFVASSDHVRDWCVCHGLPADKFSVIAPGVPPARASDVSRDALLGELRLPLDAKLIGVVGRLVPEKRVKDLIWAADLLRVLHDNLRLLVIGDGPLRSQLEQYARLASDLEHIQFLGERPDVWRIMPHLDVLWNGSEDVSHSISILEAMAAGIPVVASDTPFNREFVEGESGYLIPLGSRAGRAARARSTDRVFTDAIIASRLGTVASERINQHFDSNKMVKNHLRLYADL